MDSDLRRFADRVQRLAASVGRRFSAAIAGLSRPGKDYASQRMCPFCGLITPRSKRLCMECGKALKAIQVDRKDLPQE
jgi:hypothetical protein